MSNIVAIVQARMGSSRFPGKVLVPLAGKCSLERIYNSLSKVNSIDNISIATTTNPADDAIFQFLPQVDAYRGDENDVLKRVYECALVHNADIIVDVTGDCPLIDPDMIEEMITRLQVKGYDYYSNVVQRSWPDGLDAQVYTFEVLEYLHNNVEGIHRAHTGWNVLKFADKFRVGFLEAPLKYRLPDLAVTLDTVEDAEVLSAIFSHIDGKDYSVFEVIDYVLAHPEIMDLNKEVIRKIPGEG